MVVLLFIINNNNSIDYHPQGIPLVIKPTRRQLRRRKTFLTVSPLILQEQAILSYRAVAMKRMEIGLTDWLMATNEFR